MSGDARHGKDAKLLCSTTVLQRDGRAGRAHRQAINATWFAPQCRSGLIAGLQCTPTAGDCAALGPHFPPRRLDTPATTVLKDSCTATLSRPHPTGACNELNPPPAAAAAVAGCLRAELRW
jgi:hypothetical protein